MVFHLHLDFPDSEEIGPITQNQKATFFFQKHDIFIDAQT